MKTLPVAHPNNETMWMPDFYRKLNFYHAAGIEHIDGLEPPSSTFPKIPKEILDHIADTVKVLRNDDGTLVEVPRVDPVKQTFYFHEASGPVDTDELALCGTSLFKTIHTNSWYFKPSIEEIALQIPPEFWGEVQYLQCDRAVDDQGNELSWPPNYLIDPSTGKGIYPDRLHLATTTLYTRPESDI